MVKIQYDNKRDDGFGAQYMAIISVYCYCLIHNEKYIHKKIKNIDYQNHDYGEYTIDELLCSLNNLIGIPESEENGDIKYTHILNVYKNPNKYFTDHNLNIIRDYYSGNNITLNQVSIHIRRGDAYVEGGIRLTSNQRYINIIHKLLKKYKQDIHIYSDGKEDELNDLILDDRVKLRLNEDIIKTHNDLVNSEVLVLAKSCFSYSAALLNRNTVYTVIDPYDNLCHKNLNKWIYI
jgi:hypothetical protein